MMIPTIHLNGTGKQNLLNELETAVGALTVAGAALRQVTVHGRDYYPQGDHAYAQARHEMDQRLNALQSVVNDLMEMHVSISKA
jgi:hypothetical protein